MLVVMVIIAILVGLLIPTVGVILRTSKTGATAGELSQIASAMKAYEAANGQLPPDFTNDKAVNAHVLKCYPRNQHPVLGNNGWFTLLKNQANTNAAGELPDPAEALVFWLSGVRNNPRDPLGMQGQGEFVSFFDFDPTRLKDQDGDGLQEYYPKHAPSAPYVYFDGRVMDGYYLYTDAYYPYPASSKLTSTLGQVRPYRNNLPIDTNRDNNRTRPATTDNSTQWADPDGFQLICSGLDNEFGVAFIPDPNAQGFPIFKQFPVPNYTLSGEADGDNLATFTEGKTLEAVVP
jgi:type II secretory pathway pseudopilin PulG